MPVENLGQDLRIGLRVLRKERSFSTLAIIVLALGICGVTTMFSVVNGVMLRGFSFPNADRLASANFIDPSSANFFGVNGQVIAMDFEEIRPRAAVVRAPGGLPQRIDRQRHRRRQAAALHRRLHDRRLPAEPRHRSRSWAATSRPTDNTPGAEKVALIGYGIWQRDFGGSHDIVGKPRPHQRQARDHHRRDAERASRFR